MVENLIIRFRKYRNAALRLICCLILSFFTLSFSFSQGQTPEFRVIAFYSGIKDQAHISFVHEANAWFSLMAAEQNFTYTSTSNWNLLTSGILSAYQIVVFLDSRPESDSQREAFELYMENGGAWMGFHFCAFALSTSAYPQNWDWYHNQFLGSGEYRGNTWRPTPAFLRVENSLHPVTIDLPEVFPSSPNEWYSWKNDLRDNPDIQILLSIDSSSFPLGTGPKLYEIWHNGYYPVAWTNKNYRMIYLNMGHNDIDYEHNTNVELSYTFKNETQNLLILNTLKWLGSTKP